MALSLRSNDDFRAYNERSQRIWSNCNDDAAIGFRVRLWSTLRDRSKDKSGLFLHHRNATETLIILPEQT